MVYCPLRIVSKYEDNVRGRIGYGTPLQLNAGVPLPNTHTSDLVLVGVFFLSGRSPSFGEKEGGGKNFLFPPHETRNFFPTCAGICTK